MNLILATGQDLPDVFMGGMPTSLLVEHASQGTFIALNDFIEKDSCYFTEVLSDFPELRKIMTAPDGNIYAMPSINTSEPNMMSSRLWMDKVWLDKLGLKVPTTTAELKAVLSVFKTRDPNGNGVQDEIPLMGATTGWSTTVEPFILNGFLQYPNTGTVGTQRYVLEDGVVQAPYVRNEYRAGLQYLHGLVADGLLDMATYTQDAAQLRTLFENPGVVRIGRRHVRRPPTRMLT